MGQYGNQPDFGTRAQNITPSGNPTDPNQPLNSAALYIGTGGTLVCNVVGGNGTNNYSVFYNIPDGTFFPVIVNNVFIDNDAPTLIETTCADIVALY